FGTRGASFPYEARRPSPALEPLSRSSIMSTVQEIPATTVEAKQPARPQPVIIYGHSPLFYWWPVWAVGFLLALMTYWQGTPTQFGDAEVIVHPSKNPGVLFTVITMLVILMTHTTVRGLASFTVILGIVALTLFFAWMNWWGTILDYLGSLA